MQRRRRIRKGGSHSTLALLRKELREGNLQSLIGNSSYVVPSSNAAPDPLLSSFVYNLPLPDEPTIIRPSTESSSMKKLSDDHVIERFAQPPAPLSDKDQEEKARRCEFVQGLLLSSILDDSL
ncbi:Protein dehydration-induced 19 [Macleaya cordata]|uniref:Protein dehydration-induced 19 n=1 Tax=Macleaya cordata TaxID=56857 RepID=A0A200PWJ8_MACCD|nr:Protein dehydration-induced 19 [Macleaya cordata]